MNRVLTARGVFFSLSLSTAGRGLALREFALRDVH